MQKQYKGFYLQCLNTNTCSLGINQQAPKSMHRYRAVISLWLQRCKGIAHTTEGVQWKVPEYLGMTAQKGEDRLHSMQSIAWMSGALHWNRWQVSQELICNGYKLGLWALRCGKYLLQTAWSAWSRRDGGWNLWAAEGSLTLAYPRYSWETLVTHICCQKIWLGMNNPGDF